MKIALALIALVLGYQAFLNASKEKEGIKLLGQTIGIFVMILALLAALCGLTMMGKHSGKYFFDKGKCPYSSEAVMTK